MILIIAGTQDAREIAEYLYKEHFSLIVSVVSQYGRSLLGEKFIMNDHPLDLSDLISFIQKEKIRCVIDASHPYAVNISKNAMEACQATKICYLRYERCSVPLPSYKQLFSVPGYAEAAQKAAKLGKNIFLTTGSRNLKVFTDILNQSTYTLIARVLPDPDVLTQCLQLGFTPKTLIMMQGPFSKELNLALYRQYHAEIVIMKNSGAVGGTDTKLAAAIELGLSVVIIEKPALTYPNIAGNYQEIIEFLHKENLK